MSPLLANRLRKLKRGRLPRVWFLTDDARVADLETAIAGLPPGAGVILRHYNAADRRAIAERLAALCRRRGLLFVVAGDWRLAARLRADGLHLPAHAARRGAHPGARLWRVRARALLTAAARGPADLARARNIGAAAALLSPVFSTESHPDRAPIGRVRAGAWARRAGIAVLALGGAAPRQLPCLTAAGLAGIAGIGFALKRKT